MKTFLIVVFGAQLVSIILGVLLALFDKKVCLSQKCEELAALLRARVDGDVDPCEDFYQFVCGRLVRNHGNDAGSQGMVDRSNIEQVKRLFQLLTERPLEGEPRAFTKTKLVMALCLFDTESITAKMVQVNELLRKMGGFPTVEGDEWNETEWTWTETVKQIKNQGLLTSTNVLINLQVTVDVFDPPKYVVLVNNPYFLSSAIASCNPNIDTDACRQDFVSEYVTYAVLLGADRTQAEEDAVIVLLIELALYQLSARFPSVVSSASLMTEDNIVSLADMNLLYDFVDWVEVITYILPKHKLVPKDLQVFVGNSDYLRTLRPAFASFSNRHWANYMMWNVVKQNILGSMIIPDSLNRNQFCLNYLLGHMEVSLNAMYIEKYPDPRGSDLNIVREMVSQLRSEISKSVTKAEWMSAQTKLKSLAKIEYLISRYGDLGVLNDTFVDDFYQELSIKGNAFEVMLRVKKLRQDNYFRLLFYADAFLVELLQALPLYFANAAYIPLDNSINIIQGILRKPIFDVGWPAYINYGRVGSVVGHEMTHALDASGHHYDYTGRLRDTWDNQTYAVFSKTGQCLVDQFNDFYNASPLLEYPTFSGKYKLTENMADTGGLRLSLRAYRNHTRSTLWPDLLLPNFNYNQEQMFFISYALFWCSKRVAGRGQFVFDSHAPNDYRVFSSLHNNPYFKEVFRCGPESKMVSRKMCNVW